ncbi:MAG: PAS domain-containing protein [Sphingomonadaceae bacterium]|nr:PAS domain-containing protein [Sphingomonadaceae bacterium]
MTGAQNNLDDLNPDGGHAPFRNDLQKFMSRLTEALRPLADPKEIQTTAAAMIGKKLGAERSFYHEIDEQGWATSTNGYASGRVDLPEKIYLDDFGDQWLGYYRSGTTVVVEDVDTDPRFSDQERIAWSSRGAYACLAVPLLKGGKLRAILALNNSSPRVWAPADIALAEDVADRTWDAVERARADTVADESRARLRASEHKYRTLFENIETGFCIIRMKFDPHGNAVDYRLEEVNPAFEKQTGLNDVVGKWVSNAIPGLEQHWFDAYGTVAKTGKPARFENFAEPFGRWYDVYAHPMGEPDSHCVAVFFHDVTERKNAAAALRLAEERQAYLLAFSDYLRPFGDAAQIKMAAGEFLGKHLDANRVIYFEVDGSDYVAEGDYANGVENVSGRYPIESFGEQLFETYRRGEVAVSHDCLSDPTLSHAERNAFRAVEIGAYIGVPLVKNDELIGGLAVHSARPRRWTDEEILRVTKAADRIWAAVERARAEAKLRAREAELARTQRISGVASIDIDVAGGLRGVRSPEYCLLHGLGSQTVVERHDEWLERIHPDDRELAQRTFDDALARGDDYESEYRIVRRDNGETRWISAKGVFYRNADQEIERLVGAHIDITDRKRAEAITKEAEARFRLLVETMPQLVWKAANPASWVWASPQWTEYTGQAQADSHGHGWLEPVHPDDRGPAMQAWSQATDNGILEIEFRLFHKKEQRYRWFHTRALPVRDDGGSIIEWVGTSTDIDDLRSMQDRMHVMVAELQHRTRNLLGVVNATMSSTLRDTADLNEFSELFRRRLHALARVNALLSRKAEGERVTFDELIRMELEGVGALDDASASNKIDLVGPAGVKLRSATIQTFALAIHELATNALKYGALAQDEGRLSVSWDIRTDISGRGRRLHLVWHETGIDMANQTHAPGRGYGRELIERALPYQLQATTFYELRSDGICCTINLPLSKLIDEEFDNE